MTTPSQQAFGNGQALDYPDKPTAFELKCAELGLKTEKEMLESPALKAWAKKHRFSRYVPEGLLTAWHLKFNFNMDGRGQYREAEF